MKVTNLKAYLANIGMKMKDFCESIDCDQGYLSHILSTGKPVGRRLSRDIENATNGIIKLKTRQRKISRSIRTENQKMADKWPINENKISISSDEVQTFHSQVH